MGNIGNGIFNHGRMSQVVCCRVVLKTGTTAYISMSADIH